jgi:hypothetical protein
MVGVLWQTSGVHYGGSRGGGLSLDSGRQLSGQQSMSGGGSVTPRGLALLLAVFSPGLLLVDHVHFQYNGKGGEGRGGCRMHSAGLGV